MIHIYSIQYNRPEFIELQKKSFDKFIKNYKFTVIDNSLEIEISNTIEKTCVNNNIDFIKTIDKFDSRINGLHGFAHEVGINVFLNQLKNFHNINDIVILLDHDVFLISDFSKLFTIINESSILTIKQERSHVYYLWPGLSIFNLKNCYKINELSLDGVKLINGQWIPIDNGVFTDVGGHSYHYLNKYKDNIILYDLMNFFTENIEVINDKYIFYHFHDGSQWSKYSNDIWNNKFENIKKILE